MPDDLPPEWLATLDAVLKAPASITPAARLWGAAAAMVAAGWIAKFEEADGKAHWSLTPWAAEKLGYVLVERVEGEPVWVRHVSDPRAGADHPDPPLVATLHPRERRLPDASWLNIPDPHADPARAEARRRAMRNKARRRKRRAQWKAEREGRAVEPGGVGRAG